MCRMPPKLRLDTPWPMHKAGLRATPAAVTFCADVQMYAVLVTCQVSFHLQPSPAAFFPFPYILPIFLQPNLAGHRATPAAITFCANVQMYTILVTRHCSSQYRPFPVAYVLPHLITILPALIPMPVCHQITYALRQDATLKTRRKCVGLRMSFQDYPGCCTATSHQGLCGIVSVGAVLLADGVSAMAGRDPRGGAGPQCISRVCSGRGCCKGCWVSHHSRGELPSCRLASTESVHAAHLLITRSFGA